MLQLNRITFTVFCLVFMLFSMNTTAHEHKKAKGKVNVEKVWARATFALAKTGAVYLKVNNQSKHDIKLLSVSVDSSVASEAQLHETTMSEVAGKGMDGGMMQMREAESGFAIPAGSGLEFSPGGKHIMLLGLEKALSVGDKFILSLIFENNKVMRVPVAVKDAR
ncbi:MAG: copper(I)-binding protein [Glaciecola sp.]|jgi:copper(I)-binding protein